MTHARSLAAALLAASGLVFTSGCPDSKTAATVPLPAPGPSTPARVDAPPAPPPPPARPKEGWGAVAVGSSFETVTRSHFENGALPDSEKRTVQTVVGFDPDGVRVKLVDYAGDTPEPEAEQKYTFKSAEKDPDAKKPETAVETLTVAGKSYECEVTTEVEGDSTTKTWRTRSLPVPVKREIKGGGLQSTSELIKVDLK